MRAAWSLFEPSAFVAGGSSCMRSRLAERRCVCPPARAERRSGSGTTGIAATRTSRWVTSSRAPTSAPP
eukprot:6738353-Prymnesium_polylepis.1